MADRPSVRSTRGSTRNISSVRSRALGRMPSTLIALGSLQTEERRAALNEAVRSFEEHLVIRPQETGWVNVLARTFFSYSAEGFSPARLAWEAVIRGLSVVGTADFDNLGALGETFAAGDALSIRATVSLETLATVQSYSDRDINCPGAPGFMFVLGAGFTEVPSLDTEHGRLIASLPDKARDRNIALIGKINALLAPVSVDYQEDVVPLTPAGNASGRHLCAAYARKARTIFTEFHDLAVFWADVLGRSPTDAECLLGDDNAFMDVLSEKLEQMGLSIYCQTQPNDYPPITEFFRAVKASGAVPCLFWRDGQSLGESNPDKLLDDALLWGAHAIGLTPDSSWNLDNPDDKAKKLASLAELVRAARERHLPLLAGSLMNKPGQKFVDSFDAPEIAPFFRDFSDSAFWLYGHTTMQRAAGMGLYSEWAAHHFSADRAKANAFYLELGKKALPGKAARTRIASLGSEVEPGEILDAL